MFVVGCYLFDVLLLLRLVCWLSFALCVLVVVCVFFSFFFVVRGSPFVFGWLMLVVGCWLLVAVWRLFWDVCCLSFDLLFVVCDLFSVLCYLLFVVSSLLFGVGCFDMSCWCFCRCCCLLFVVGVTSSLFDVR